MIDLLDDVETALAKATPGNWAQVWRGKDGSFTVAIEGGPNDGMVIASRNILEHRANESLANAHLIAHAPEWLSALLARVRTAEAAYAKEHRVHSDLLGLLSEFYPGGADIRECLSASKQAERERDALLRLKVHCEKCGADYARTGLETGCPCELRRERDSARAEVERLLALLDQKGGRDAE